MKLDDMEITHSVELEILHENKKTTLLTRVEGIIKNHVLLTPIKIDGKIVGFPKKYTVHLHYPENGQLYSWRDVTVKAVRYQGQLYHMVELYDSAITENRRGAYRVFVGETMQIQKMTAHGAQVCDVFVKDISETGACFMADPDFDANHHLRLQLRFRSGQELRLRCEVVWKKENQNRKTTFLYGCRFTEKNKLLGSYLMGLQQAKQRKRIGR